MDQSFTAQLADLAVQLTTDDVPSPAMDLVELAFIDTIGCALAGSRSEEVRLAAGWAVGLEARPEATVIGGRGERLPAAFAAMVNATAGHALDLDDVSPAMTHPSTCLVPPLLAVSERTGASGADLMMAYIAGFEVCVRLCRVLNPEHYYRGWHSMSTVNGLGVAAATARLLGLDARGVRMAMAIAAASSSGIRKNFGTMVKPLHAGQAAFHGVQAAELAASGFVADDAILDGQHGYLEVFGDDDTVVADVDISRLELVDSGIIFKRYACCGALHPAIDAVLDLVARHSIRPEDIVRISCSVNSRAPAVLVHHQVVAPAEGRFSVEYSLAVAAIDSDAGPAQYTTERVADPEVQRLSRSVTVVVDDDLPTGYALFPAEVTIETAHGGGHTQRHDIARGDPKQPFGPDEIIEKFRRCAAFVLDADGVKTAERAVVSLRDSPNVSQAVSELGG
jgi:2-methylcitrate dehydratase PrpD